MTQIANVIGFHTGPGGNRRGLFENWAVPINNAGLPFFLKAVDDFGPLEEAVELKIPYDEWRANHELCFRISTAGSSHWYDFDVPNYNLDPRNAAQLHLNRFLEYLEFKKIPFMDYADLITWEPINEVDKNRSEWLAEFCIYLIQLAELAGIKRTAVLAWAGGEPEPEHWRGDTMQTLLRILSNDPENRAIALHEYSYVSNDITHGYPFKIGRFQDLMAACDENCIKRPKILITEWGWTLNTVPQPEQALDDIRWAMRNVYGPYTNVKGAAIWYLGPSFGNIADQAQKLIEPVGNMTASELFEVTINEPPEPPTDKTLEQQLWDAATNLQVLSLNADAALQKAMQTDGYGPVGNEGRKTINGQTYAVQQAETWDGRLQPRTYFAPVSNFNDVKWTYDPYTPPKPPPFELTHWPTSRFTVNQWFGENPDRYAEFGLPGHDGLDLYAETGDKIYACADGIVSYVERNPNTHNYGIHVRINHSNDRQTIYGHLLSVNVVVGQRVEGGEVIGRADNTGNSYGSHLHLGMKHIGSVYTDLNGNQWGYNLEDPWPYLQHIIDADIDRNGKIGWLWANSLQRNQQGDYVRAVGNLNLREFASATSKLVGIVPNGSVAMIMNGERNGYLPVNVVSQEPPDPPDQATKTLIGLHASADGGNGPGWPNPVRDEFKALQPEIVKFLSSHNPAVVRDVVADNISTLKRVVVRAFMSWGGRPITPQQFVGDTLSDVQRTVDAIADAGLEKSNILIELHNEPNLHNEGHTLSWTTGAECVDFFAMVRELYGNSLDGVRYGIGGLSPGGTVPDQRYNATSFLYSMLSSNNWSMFDVYFIHLYSVGPWSDEIGWLDLCQTQTNMDIYITESSTHLALTGEQYAANLYQLIELLDQRPCLGVTFYCASASNKTFWHEAWCHNPDRDDDQWQNVQSRGIGSHLRDLIPLP
jgi:murein DD-endopeptidase MepM/ murein hydrolase activator NlpD